MRKPDMLPENWGLGLTAGVLVAGIVLIVMSWLLWLIPYPLKYTGYWQHMRYWAAWRLEDFLPFLATWGRMYQAYLHRIDMVYPSWWLSGRFDVAAVLALGSGCWMGFLAGKPESAITHEPPQP